MSRRLFLLLSLCFFLGFNGASAATNPPAKKRILFIMTSNGELFGSGKKTGVWLDGLAIPYYLFKKAGYDMTLASVHGLQPPIDPRSEAEASASGKRFLADKEAMQQFANTVPVDEVQADGYDALFFPGGHGVMWDTMDNLQLTNLVNHFTTTDKIIAAVDHGAVGLLLSKNAAGKEYIIGRKMTVFTQAEEKVLKLDNYVPSYPDAGLKLSGAVISSAPPFQPNVVQDGNLITGQNPASIEKVAQLTLKALQKQAK